ncbi:toxin glutamine deamidase domain-containing protein, partial [Nocardia carnea]
MTLYLPEEMRWLGWIAGAEWPDGDEDAAWAVSAIWKDGSDETFALLAAVVQAKEAAAAAYPAGAARDEIAALYDQFRTGDQSLEALARSMLETSDTTFDFGTELQAAKLNIIITLCWLAIEIALAWLFPPTAPAVEAAAVGTTQGIMLAIRQATQRTLQNLASRLGAPNIQRSFWRSLGNGKLTMPTSRAWGELGEEVLQGAAEEGLINGAIQGGQMADGKRDEFNGEEFGLSVFAGGAAEPVGSLVARGANNFISKTLGNTLNTNMLGRMTRNAVVGGTADGVAGIFGNLLVAGVTGQSLSESITGIGTAGGFIQGSIVGAADPTTFASGFHGGNGPWSSARNWLGDPDHAMGGPRSGAVPTYGDGSSGENALYQDGPAGGGNAGSGSAPADDSRSVFASGGPGSPRGESQSPGTWFSASGDAPGRSGERFPSGESTRPDSAAPPNPAEGQPGPERRGGPPDAPATARNDSTRTTPAGGDANGRNGSGATPESGPPGQRPDSPVAGQPGPQGVGGETSNSHTSGHEPEKVPEGDKPGSTVAPVGETSPGLPPGDNDQPAASEAAIDKPGQSDSTDRLDQSDTGRPDRSDPTSNSGESDPRIDEDARERPDSATTDERGEQRALPNEGSGPSGDTDPSGSRSREGGPEHSGGTGETAPSGTETGRQAPPLLQPVAPMQPAPPGTPVQPNAAPAGPASSTAPGSAPTQASASATEQPSSRAGDKPGSSTTPGASTSHTTRDLPNQDGAQDTNTGQSRTASPPASIAGVPDEIGVSVLPETSPPGLSAAPAPVAPPLPPDTPVQPATEPERNTGPQQQRSGPAQPGDTGPARRPAEQESGPAPESRRARPGELSSPAPRRSPEQVMPPAPATDSRQKSGAAPDAVPVPFAVDAGPRVGPVRSPDPPNRREAAAPVTAVSTGAPPDASPDALRPGPRRFTPEELRRIPQPAADRVGSAFRPVEKPSYHKVLEAAVRNPDGSGFVQFRNPATFTAVAGGKPYGMLVNGPGPDAPGRSENCQDCSLSLLATFAGKPQVAAPWAGRFSKDHLHSGPAQAARFLGARETSFDNGSRSVADQYRAAHDHIKSLPPGTMAYVTTTWHKVNFFGMKQYEPDGSPKYDGSHATVVVLPEGEQEPIWCDPQSGTFHRAPPASLVKYAAKVEFTIGTPDLVLAAAEHRQELEAALSNGNGGFTAYQHPGIFTAVPGGRPYGELMNLGGGYPMGGQISVYESGLAAATSFLGAPRYAVPNWEHLNEGGHPLPDRELHRRGRSRVEGWFGDRLTSLATGNRTVRQQYQHAYDEIRNLGPGAVGLAVVSRPVRGSSDPAESVQLLVYPAGPVAADGTGPTEPVWWDPMTGRTVPHTTMLATLGNETEISFVAAPGDELIALHSLDTSAGARGPQQVAAEETAGDPPEHDPPQPARETGESSSSGQRKRPLPDPESGAPPQKQTRTDASDSDDAPGPVDEPADDDSRDSDPADSDSPRSEDSVENVSANRQVVLPEPPMELLDPAEMRVFGPGYLAPVEDPALQHALENAMRRPDGFARYADPSSYPPGGTPFGEMINPGHGNRPGRDNNCQDCVLAGLATFLGRPTVAAPIYPAVAHGEVNWDGPEQGGSGRQHWMVGLAEYALDGFGTVPERITAIHAHVARLGPGSAAIVSNRWQAEDPETGDPMVDDDGEPVEGPEHTVLVVYPAPDPDNLDENGAVIDEGPLWWDPQSGRMSRAPFEDFRNQSLLVMSVVIPPGRTVVSASARQPVPVPQQPVPPRPRPAVVPALGRPAPPARLPDPAARRPSGQGGLAPLEHPGQQRALENVLRSGTGGFVVGADPRSYPTPGYPYGWMINGGRSRPASRFANRWDALLAGLSSFRGNPLVAAPRNPDAGDRYDRADEAAGMERVIEWLQTQPDHFGEIPAPQQFAALHDWVGHLGPGSAAVAFVAIGEVDPATGDLARDDNEEYVVSGIMPLALIFPVIASDGNQTSSPTRPQWWDPASNTTWEQLPDQIVHSTVQFGFIALPPDTTVDASGRGPVVRPVPVPLVVPVFNRAGPPMRLMDPSRGRVFGPGQLAP